MSKRTRPAHNATLIYVVRRDVVHSEAEARRLVAASGGEHARLESDDKRTTYRYVCRPHSPCERNSHRPAVVAGGKVMVLFCTEVG